MTTPQFSLLGFAIWTLIVPLGAVAFYRWSRILTGGARINDFPADAVTGLDWYRRAMRAHANCVENLPVFASVVLLMSLIGVAGSWADALTLVVLIGRMLQSSVHIFWKETVLTVSIRFACFLLQVLSTLALAAALLLS